MDTRTVIEFDGVYYLQLKTKKRQLTNFIIRAIVDNSGEASGKYELMQRGRVQDVVSIHSGAWSSRSEFLRIFHGIGNYAFYGQAADVRLVENCVHQIAV